MGAVGVCTLMVTIGFLVSLIVGASRLDTTSTLVRNQINDVEKIPS